MSPRKNFTARGQEVWEHANPALPCLLSVRSFRVELYLARVVVIPVILRESSRHEEQNENENCYAFHGDILA